MEIYLYQSEKITRTTIFQVTFNVSGLLVVDESGFITACNHHFAMLTFGKPLSEVVGRHIEELIQNFCGESDIVKLPERNRQMTLSPVNNGESGTGEKALEMATLSFLIILYCTRKSHRTI